jgi:hypothetical protein
LFSDRETTEAAKTVKVLFSSLVFTLINNQSSGRLDQNSNFVFISMVLLKRPDQRLVAGQTAFVRYLVQNCLPTAPP